MTQETKRIVAQTENLTLTQYRCLLALTDTTNPHTVTELAKNLFVKKSTISTALNYLEDRGFISRVENQEDRRIVILTITPKGLSCVENIDGALLAFIKEFWIPLAGEGAKSSLIGAIAHTQKYRTIRVKDNKIQADVALVISVVLSLNEIQASLKPCDISLTQFRILQFLQENETRQTFAAIAHALLLHEAEVSSACNQLVERKFVTRKRPQENRRIAVLELTDSGRTFTDECATRAFCVIENNTPADFSKESWGLVLQQNQIMFEHLLMRRN